MKKPLFALLVALLVLPVMARAADDPPPLEGILGYSLLVVDGESIPKGFLTGLQINSFPSLSLVFDLSYHYKNYDVPLIGGSVQMKTSEYIYMGGLQYNFRQHDTVTPFFRGLIGGARAKALGAWGELGSPILFTEATNVFATGLGAGIDLKLTENVGLRLIQYDYIRLYGDAKLNQPRFGFALKFH